MKWFCIDELCASTVAERYHIRNVPTAAVRYALTNLVENILDPLRDAWGAPLRVNSGYRCAELNRAVGGVKNSQHLFGEAADITAGSHAANRRLLNLIVSLDLPFDQLIDECGCRWVHVSYREGRVNRRQLLRVGL
ncbi:MAG: peptidase M15 [Muribaculaceae bacterium]|nr:peptidase M15 [Muribaculaceae bacterium]